MDGMYILGQVLQAVRILSQTYGRFSVREEMVGINIDGKCKFWFNCDYASMEKEMWHIDEEIPLWLELEKN